MTKRTGAVYHGNDLNGEFYAFAWVYQREDNPNLVCIEIVEDDDESRAELLRQVEEGKHLLVRVEG